MNLSRASLYLLLGMMAWSQASCGSATPDGGGAVGKAGTSGEGGSAGKGGSSGAGGGHGGAGGAGSGGRSGSGGAGKGGSSGAGGNSSGGSTTTEGTLVPSSLGGKDGGGGTAGKAGGAAGTVATGGRGGGGSAGANGGAAGKADAGGPLGGSGGGSSAACTITIKTKSLSTVIPTVGIVEWSTDLSGITEAAIEFGLDTQYGMTAPVDLKETNYRTLILGMKAGGKTYHFRVVAKAGNNVCTGQDNTLPATGEPPNILPQLKVTPATATATGLDGGFLVTETFKMAFGASGDGAAFIIDGDGDFVWWYVVKGFIDLSRARQSYDGKHMWISTVNVMSNTQKMLRVKMDGSDAQDLTKEFGNTNHDFAVRSDETVAFIAYGSNNCDDIKERSPDGKVTTIINSGSAVGGSACHCNAIQYDRNDDTIVFSELDTSSIVKVTRDTKKVVWLMSSQNSKATVTGMTWRNQHGIHILDETHLLFFNNNTGPNSAALEAELSLNGGKGTAKQTWSYPSTITVQYMGDVQRLDNGNTLITYSTGGEVREVSPSGSVLQTIKVSGSGNLIGFSEKRKSLYGPPPR